MWKNGVRIMDLRSSFGARAAGALFILNKSKI